MNLSRIYFYLFVSLVLLIVDRCARTVEPWWSKPLVHVLVCVPFCALLPALVVAWAYAVYRNEKRVFRRFCTGFCAIILGFLTFSPLANPVVQIRHSVRAGMTSGEVKTVLQNALGFTPSYYTVPYLFHGNDAEQDGTVIYDIERDANLRITYRAGRVASVQMTHD